MRSQSQTLSSGHGLMTIADASEFLGFHPVTLRKWARSGRLPVIRIASRWRLDPRSLAAWLEAGKTAGRAEDDSLDRKLFTSRSALRHTSSLQTSQVCRPHGKSYPK